MGATRNPGLAELTDGYAARFSRYFPFETVCLPDVRNTKGNEERQKILEGEKIIEAAGTANYLVLLDERGREYTSREFAAFLAAKANRLPGYLIFCIGGPYGFSKAVYDRADAMLSLSKMTFPHELVRLFAVEQLYRAATILRGEPYHHD